MINNTEELKNLIIWCKQQKIKSVKLNGIEFEISEISFIQEENVNPLKETTGEYNTDTLIDTDKTQEDWENDPDLFHSTDI